MKIIIPIIPTPQARARSWSRPGGGYAKPYKSASQNQAEAHLISFLAPHRPPERMAGAVYISIYAYLPIPASMPKKKAALAREGSLRPTTTPDADNLAKQVLDCLTAAAFWRDDKQVVSLGVSKFYDDGQGPRWEIAIRETPQ